MLKKDGRFSDGCDAKIFAFYDKTPHNFVKNIDRLLKKY